MKSLQGLIDYEPIPTSGKDYMGLQNITINSNTIEIETAFELEVLVY
jgi:hypothetical protein